VLINGIELLMKEPIKDMIATKETSHGVSWGMSEVGYDIRVKQTIEWIPPDPVRAFELFESRFSFDPGQWDVLFLQAFHGYTIVSSPDDVVHKIGRTALASSIEEFQINNDLWCEFRNKSTHARRFIDPTLVTDGEPGWKGFLTIEICFHDLEPIIIPAGSGLLKAVFHQVVEPVTYQGKYQSQDDRPVPAILR
jgi:dCTP deaminase